MAYGSKFKIHEAQLLGKQSYRYAFVPSSKGFEPVMPEVESFRHPVYGVQKDFLEAECMPDYVALPEVLPATAGFLSVKGDVVTTCLKPAENGEGIVLRFYNPSNKKQKVEITTDAAWKLVAANAVRMDETCDEALDVSKGKLAVTAGPKKILSFRLFVEKA
jgi:alpha-mannosidase